MMNGPVKTLGRFLFLSRLKEAVKKADTPL